MIGISVIKVRIYYERPTIRVFSCKVKYLFGRNKLQDSLEDKYIKGELDMNYIKQLLLAVCLNVIILWGLTTLFPYTGLGRIIAFPLIFVINMIIATMGCIVTRFLNAVHKGLVWAIIVVLSIIVAIWLFPQDSGISVIVKIIDWIKGN